MKFQMMLRDVKTDDLEKKDLQRKCPLLEQKAKQMGKESRRL